MTFAYLGGISSISGAFVAGVLAPLGLSYVVFDRWLGASLGYQLFAAVGLILTAIFNPEGIAGATRVNWAAMRAKRKRVDAAADEVEPGGVPTLSPTTSSAAANRGQGPTHEVRRAAPAGRRVDGTVRRAARARPVQHARSSR